MSRNITETTAMTQHKPARVLLFFVLGILFTAPCYAQDRSRLTVYVPMPTGGTAAQRAYFEQNFKLELIGANYPPVETKPESMYTLLLDITNNPGFDRNAPEEKGNERYFLGVKLERSADNIEIISFNFGFNDTESMAQWNLYLLYQALANAYVPPEELKVPEAPPPTIDDRWRNQWLYLNLNAGLDLGFFLRLEDDRIQTGTFMPALLAGAELHFLDYLSVELDPIKPRFISKLDAASLAAAATMKVVFKFSTLMMEVYGGVEYAYGLIMPIPPMSVLAGVQVGIRGAPQSAWVMEIGVTRNLAGVFQGDNGVDYDLLRFHLLGGYKFGFFDRMKLPAAER